MRNEKRTLIAKTKSGMTVHLVENVDFAIPPDHQAFDDPVAERRWLKIHRVATTLLGMSEFEAYVHANETVFGELKDI